ncbi:MAG: sugar ABC transporter permease [Roseitalea porphyridii]|jgi:raffinose/stachyose/melibiose transport system permease protein|uniref:carbohydrate ABC transporter permease n=1 Tax=Roseitalea porphyridii TaxID=1852022 RepID=UPI0032EE32C8
MQKSLGLSIFVSLLPAIALFVTFLAFPFATILVTSFFEWNAAGMTFNGGANYLELWDSRSFRSALQNTAIWVGAAVLIHVPLAAVLAMILSRRVKGWKVFQTLFFLPNIVSYSALAIVFLGFYNARYGALNMLLEDIGLGHLQQDWLFQYDTALYALIATWIFHVGLYMIIIMAEIASIPEDMYEAAVIEGASEVQQDWYITLPLLRNVIGTCMILTVTQSLIYFEGIFLTTKGGPANASLNMSMATYRAFETFDWGEANAIGMHIVLLGVVAIVLIRHVFRIGERDFD